MQLNEESSVRRALALATCTLLGTGAHEARADGAQGAWRTDSSILYYSEKDRVTVIEPALFLRKQTGDDSFVNLRIICDTMTGASPNGATPTNTAQTFTGASGGGSYTTPAGQTPLRDFSDQRIAVAAEWEEAGNRLNRSVFGINGSIETDYASFGAGKTWMRDTEDKLTTWTTGLSANLDFVSPDNGAPNGMQLLSAATASSGHGDDHEGGVGGDGETKVGVDAIVGVTRVLTRRILTQLNYSVGYTSGYLTDPYKLVSVVDGTTGATLDYRYEKRPDTRLRQNVYWKGVYGFDHDVVNLSYRYYRDDWGMKAHTVDLHYRFELWKGAYLQPHARWSSQTAADFYRHSLANNDPVPANASADYRLGEMVTTTFGIKFGLAVAKNSELSARFEKMTQSGESHPQDAIGIQRNFDLFPTIKTTLAQITYISRF
jgi:hypothetical protein